MNEFLNQREIKRSVIATLILLSVFLLAKSINEFKLNSTIGQSDFANTISVSGQGEVSVAPNIANFSFSVTEESKTVKVAQDSVSEKVSKILKALKELGIEEKDIKTLNYSVYPRYEYLTTQRICPTGSYCPPTSNRELVGYEVSQTVLVKLKDLEKAGKVLNSLGELKATNISGPDFDVEDRETLIREARKKAIEDARQKAKELSKDLGVKLNKIVSFSEAGNFSPLRTAKFESFDGSLGVGGSIEPEIPRGESIIRSNVEIIYEIR